VLVRIQMGADGRAFRIGLVGVCTLGGLTGVMGTLGGLTGAATLGGWTGLGTVCSTGVGTLGGSTGEAGGKSARPSS
jgi:hypothetical protein